MSTKNKYKKHYLRYQWQEQYSDVGNMNSNNSKYNSINNNSNGNDSNEISNFSNKNSSNSIGNRL